MVSNEGYVLDKLKALMEENIKKNGSLNASFLLEIKPLIEQWSMECNEKFSKEKELLVV